MLVCIVSSCGGHLTEVRCFRRAYGQVEHFYVLNDRAILPEDMIGRTFFVAHSERDWKIIVNLWEAWRILRKQRPKVLISTGAGPAVPFGIVARLLCSVRVVFIETITRVSSPSLTGRLMYWIAHDFYYQHEGLARFFPRGRYYGSLLDEAGDAASR